MSALFGLHIGSLGVSKYTLLVRASANVFGSRRVTSQGEQATDFLWCQPIHLQPIHWQAVMPPCVVRFIKRCSFKNAARPNAHVPMVLR